MPAPKRRPVSKPERDMLLGIGRRIAELRTSSGLSQQVVADRVNSTPQRLREVESGRHNPSVLTLRRIAEALGVEIVELFRPPVSRVRPGPGRPRKVPAANPGEGDPKV